MKRRMKMFTSEEKHMLIDLVRKYPIVNDKRCDVISHSKKNKAWTEIGMAFNANERVTKKSIRQLRKFWDNMKFRKKLAQAEKTKNMKNTSTGTSGPIVEPLPEQNAVTPDGHAGFHFDSDTLQAMEGIEVVVDVIGEGPSCEPQTGQENVPAKSTSSSKKENSLLHLARKRIIEKEVEARLERVNQQKEEDRALFQLRKEEQTYLTQLARRKLEAFEAMERRKQKAFEAEERRREELHQIQLAILSKN